MGRKKIEQKKRLGKVFYDLMYIQAKGGEGYIRQSVAMLSLLAKKLKLYALCIKSRMVDSPYTFSFIYSSIIGSLVGSRGLPRFEILVGVSVLSFLITYGIYLFNDIMEIDLDKMNKVERPISQGVIPRKDAETLVLILMMTGATLSYFVNIQTFLLTLAFLAIGVIYSIPQIYLKSKFLAKNFTVGMGGALSSWIGGAAVGSLSPHVWYAGFLFFMMCFAGSTLSDVSDILGDKNKEVKTIALVIGPEFALKVSIMSYISTVIITILLYSLLGFNIIVPIIITGTGLSMAFLTFSLIGRWRQESFFRKTIRRLVAIHMIYQLGLVLGVI